MSTAESLSQCVRGQTLDSTACNSISTSKMAMVLKGNCGIFKPEPFINMYCCVNYSRNPSVDRLSWQPSHCCNVTHWVGDGGKRGGWTLPKETASKDLFPKSWPGYLTDLDNLGPRQLLS